MKKVLAVSGGVDSMVLFDVMLGEVGADELVVAHFDHGTRPSSAADAEFVRRICEGRGVQFETERRMLGAEVSEEVARAQRYAFLRAVAVRYAETGTPAVIYTAHHLDDLVESVAINLLRGTGWRGLTPMRNPGICRPLLERGWSRADMLCYAAEHGVKFRQDPTNVEDKYLRNRVRAALVAMAADERTELYHQMNILWQKQGEIRAELEKIIQSVIYSVQQYPRGWFQEVDDAVGLELVRGILEKAGIAATRPQMLDFLSAIREYVPEKSFNLPRGKLVKIHKTYFVI